MPKIGSIKPFGLRINPELKEWLKKQARASQSSLNSEIVRRLQESRSANEKAPTAPTVEAFVQQ